MRNQRMIEKRNAAVKKKYAALCKKYPHYKFYYILKMVADEFFITQRTVYSIITKKDNNERIDKKN